MKKSVISEINEIKKMMGLLTEEEIAYDLPIQRIGDDDFYYQVRAANGKQIVLSGDKNGQNMRPILYDVKGYHPDMGNFDVLILRLSEVEGDVSSMTSSLGSIMNNLSNDKKIKKKLSTQTGPKRTTLGLEGRVKPDTYKWAIVKLATPSEYLSGDYLKVKIDDGKVRRALKQLASSNGRSATIDVGKGLKLYLTKNREL